MRYYNPIRDTLSFIISLDLKYLKLQIETIVKRVKKNYSIDIWLPNFHFRRAIAGKCEQDSRSKFTNQSTVKCHNWSVREINLYL